MSEPIGSRQNASLFEDSRFRDFFLDCPEVEVDPLTISPTVGTNDLGSEGKGPLDYAKDYSGGTTIA